MSNIGHSDFSYLEWMSTKPFRKKLLSHSSRYLIEEDQSFFLASENQISYERFYWVWLVSLGIYPVSVFVS